MSTENVSTYKHELPADPGGHKRVLSYAVLGLPLESHGTPEQYIIYHHGWPSCRLEALPLHDVAFNLNWRILAVDRPGIGSSTYHPAGTFEQWAKDIENLLDAQGIQTAVMVGMSGGGPFACACARYLPHRTAALVTIASMISTNDPANQQLTARMHWLNRLNSAAIDYTPTALRLAMAVSWPAMLLAPYPMGLVQALPDGATQLIMKLITAVGYAAADQKLLETRPEAAYLMTVMLQQSVAQGVQGVMHDMTITMNPWSFQLRDIKVPVALVFQGDADINVPKEMAAHLAAEIPGAVVKYYPGEGHISLLVNQAADMLLSIQAALQQSGGASANGAS